MNEINDIWDQIESWYRVHNGTHLLNSGASEEDIAAAESRLELTFSAELRASLMRGGLKDSPLQELLNLERLLEEEEVWRSNREGGLPLDDEELIMLDWHPEKWVPVTWDFGSNGYYINLHSGPNHGSIFFLDHETGPSISDNFSGLNFTNYVDMLVFLLKALNDNSFDVSEAIMFDSTVG